MDFVGSGKCIVSIVLPQTVRYNKKSLKISVNVLERGLTSEQLKKLSTFAFNDANNSKSNRQDYISYGGFLKHGEDTNLTTGWPVKVVDVRKTWRMKGTVAMPALPGTECVSLHVRYSREGKFGYTGNTSSKTVTQCTGQSPTFDFCREFTPVTGWEAKTGAPSPLPEDEQATVLFDFLNWGLVWTTTPVDHVAAAASPPKVTVTEVRPGSCP